MDGTSGIDSAKLKLLRAAEHISAVKSCIRAYTADEPSLITIEPDGKKKVSFWRPPPVDIAVLAGEAIYQIRSALDHLAFNLVQLNPDQVVLPNNWEKRCEFPLLTEVPTKGNPPVPVDLPLPYNFFERSLPGISKQSFTFVESLQPYYRLYRAGHLGYLVVLSNIDKHRHLHIINPQSYYRRHIRFANGFHSLSIIRIEDGAKIEPDTLASGNTAGAVNVEGVVNPFVSFDESALGIGPDTLPVDTILELCLDVAETVIVPAFEKFLQDG